MQGSSMDELLAAGHLTSWPAGWQQAAAISSPGCSPALPQPLAWLAQSRRPASTAHLLSTARGASGWLRRALSAANCQGDAVLLRSAVNSQLAFLPDSLLPLFSAHGEAQCPELLPRLYHVSTRILG